jgi:ketosteroid isomerase-like protein
LAAAQANIELARRGYEAFTTGDPEGVLGFLDPNIDVHDFAEMPDAAVYHGPEGFLAIVANTLQEFDDFRLEATEFMAPDDEHVLVMVRQVARGKESGAEVEAHVVHLWRIRDGRAVELRLFGSQEEALQALGLGRSAT